jgi:hypothetical protein
MFIITYIHKMRTEIVWNYESSVNINTSTFSNDKLPPQGEDDTEEYANSFVLMSSWIGDLLLESVGGQMFADDW